MQRLDARQWPFQGIFPRLAAVAARLSLLFISLVAEKLSYAF
jgi:hypothetical protein